MVVVGSFLHRMIVAVTWPSRDNKTTALEHEIPVKEELLVVSLVMVVGTLAPEHAARTGGEGIFTMVFGRKVEGS